MVNARPSVSSVEGGSAADPPPGPGRGRRPDPSPANASILEVGVENRHRKIERPVAVLVVHEQHPDELLADIHLGRVGFLRPSYDTDRVVRKGLAHETL